MSPDVVTDTEWTRPIPRPDAVSAPYWEAAARGELMIQECTSCAHRQFYPRAVCTDCGGIDVVVWIDTVLYAPEPLRAGFRNMFGGLVS